MTATFFFAQNVHFGLKLSVRLDGVNCSKNLTSLNIFLLQPTQKNTNVVPGNPLIQSLLEHLNAGNSRFLSVTKTNNLNLLTDLHNTRLNSTSRNSTATFNREHIFNSHHKRLVSGALWLRNIAIQCLHQIGNALAELIISGIIKCTASIATNERNVVSREAVLREKFADFHFNKIQQLLVVNKIALVQKHNESRHVYLTSQQDVLASLRHRAIGCRNHKNGTVHLSSTGNHVLDVVSVTRAIDVSVVPIWRFVLNMARRNGHSLGSVTNRTTLSNIRISLNRRETLSSLNRKDCRCCCRLAVVDVTDGSHVNVRLRSLKRTLCHYPNSRSNCARTPNEARQINHEKNPTAPHREAPAHSTKQRLTLAEKLLKGLEPLTPSLPRTYSTN